MKMLIICSLLLASTLALAEDIVAEGRVTERVFEISDYLERSKMHFDAERPYLLLKTPTLVIKGVQMYPDCNGPRGGEVRASATLDEKKLEDYGYPEHAFQVHYIATRMGCGKPDFNEKNLRTFMFKEPVELPTFIEHSPISLKIRNQLIKSLIMEIKY